MKLFLIQFLKVIKWIIYGLCAITFSLSIIGLLITAKESADTLSPGDDRYATNCAIAIAWSVIIIVILWLVLPEIIKIFDLKSKK